jgi:hypothetical protein
MQMHKTRNDLPKATRAKMIELLNARLADSIDLYAQVKQAHWNVKGMQFIALHELFDKVCEAVEDGTDEIAERAVELGGVAEGTLQVVVPRTTLAPYPIATKAGRDRPRPAREGARRLRQEPARRDRDGGRRRRRRHVGPLHPAVADGRQAALVHRGAPAVAPSHRASSRAGPVRPTRPNGRRRVSSRTGSR